LTDRALELNNKLFRLTEEFDSWTRQPEPEQPATMDQPAEIIELAKEA
jgi:hypothetical protein